MLILNLLLAAFSFLSPVRFEVFLAGNFGEPRPNHFHGGIDIKTQMVEGKPIHAIGDGYVSHVSVNKGGTGYCIHVRHPEGYTSVYAHLQRFSPVIEARVKREQYRTHNCDVELDLNATDCPVRKGQVLALSGNTGASEGPHLHLEIHRTDTWALIDPLEMIPDLLADSVAPVAKAFMAYPISGGNFCGEKEKMRVDFQGDSVTRHLTAWGKVGFALNADDFMQGSYNRCGVRHTSLLVDSVEVFSADMNNVPPALHKMVNIWGDFDYYYRNGEWFLKSFIVPANTLPMLSADKNRGFVLFNEERDYHLSYVLSDFFGNTSVYRFTVTGVPGRVDSLEESTGKRHLADTLTVWRDKDNVITLDDGELTLPKGVLLAEESKVNAVKRPARNGYSDIYNFSDVALPMDGNAEVKLRLHKMPEDATKLYISARERNRESYVKAEYANGWLSGQVNSAHALLQAAYDNQPPQLTVTPSALNDSLHIITISLSDGQSGVAHVEGYVDEEFVLFERVNKTNRMICKLEDTPVRRKGTERMCTVVASDCCGNEARQSVSIVY